MTLATVERPLQAQEQGTLTLSWSFSSEGDFRGAQWSSTASD